MAKLNDVATELVAAHLEPSEPVVAVVRANRKGTVKQMAAYGAIGGIVGVAIAQKAGKAGAENVGAAGFPDVQSMTLVLTDRRVFVARNSSMSNKPKELVMTVPLAEVAAVRYEAAKLVPKIFVTMSNGAEVELEAARIDKPAEFVEALAARLTARAA
jgi:hypothetical protein